MSVKNRTYISLKDFLNSLKGNLSKKQVKAIIKQFDVEIDVAKKTKSKFYVDKLIQKKEKLSKTFDTKYIEDCKKVIEEIEDLLDIENGTFAQNAAVEIL